jgi:hypothetical protein
MSLLNKGNRYRLNHKSLRGTEYNQVIAHTLENLKEEEEATQQNNEKSVKRRGQAQTHDTNIPAGHSR